MSEKLDGVRAYWNGKYAALFVSCFFFVVCMHVHMRVCACIYDYHIAKSAFKPLARVRVCVCVCETWTHCHISSLYFCACGNGGDGPSSLHRLIISYLFLFQIKNVHLPTWKSF